MRLSGYQEVVKNWMHEIRSALSAARKKLIGLGEQALPEAYVLLQSVLGKDRSWILAHLDEGVVDLQLVQYASLIDRRASGEPLPYLLGHWEFYGLDFIVTPAVLIPRPETELLVETSCTWLKKHPHKRRIVDVGTGSGCLAVSLAYSYDNVKVTGTDISMPALKVAQLNIRKHHLDERIHLLQSNLLDAINDQFDLLCANLPYIPSGLLTILDVSKYEPKLALDGGENGMVWISQLLGHAAHWVTPGGLLALEIEANQGVCVTHLAQQAFPGGIVHIIQDLTGLDRIVTVEV
jgi:release factor glutamine methyltransferase